jgi:5-oxoprolinase (ATP-hydrolysing)
MKATLNNIYQRGIRSIAVCLIHSYLYPGKPIIYHSLCINIDHELHIKAIATGIGFNNVSLSSQVMPMIKMVPRASSSVADAYLTPSIQRYIQGFLSQFDEGVQSIQGNLPRVRIEFMQSDGGLVDARFFSGFKAILSGPAAGVVGYAKTCYSETTKIPLVGFDMGGTSTDVSRFAGQFEHKFESVTAGVFIQAPQLDIHTVNRILLIACRWLLAVDQGYFIKMGSFLSGICTCF